MNVSRETYKAKKGAPPIVPIALSDRGMINPLKILSFWAIATRTIKAPIKKLKSQSFCQSCFLIIKKAKIAKIM